MTSRIPVNVEDYRRLAQRRLPAMIFDYLEGGAEDESGLAHNLEVLRRLRFRPRRLVDVSRRTLSVPLFGTTLPMPLLIGPTGFNDLFWPDGDLALARAAAKHGIPFVLSTASNASIETVARQCDGELWFQLYVVERTLAAQWIRRAAQSGYTTLVLTVDVAVNGNRERDQRNGFRLPLRYTPAMVWDGLRHPRWALRHVPRGVPQLANFVQAQTARSDAARPKTAGSDTAGADAQAALTERRMDASFAWHDLAWLRDQWPHRLLVKGVVHPDDVARCAGHGVDGVVLSNHGGRQLDACASPLESLAAAAARTDLPLLIDSGYRRGSDVVKALALGASAVMLGRATLYGLAAAGESGASDVIAMLRREIDLTLAQLGCSAVTALSPDFVCERDPAPPAADRQIPHHRASFATAAAAAGAAPHDPAQNPRATALDPIT